MAGLTDKQRAFIEYYLGEARFNATKAARLAGYAHPNTQGPTLANLGKIRDIIDERFRAMQVSANEVLAHLSEIARGSMGDFVKTDAGPRGMLDLAKAKDARALGLVKKLRWTHAGLEVELYDRLDALELLGKAHRLFIDRKEHSGPGGVPLFDLAAWERKAQEQIDAANRMEEPCATDDD